MANNNRLFDLKLSFVKKLYLKGKIACYEVYPDGDVKPIDGDSLERIGCISHTRKNEKILTDLISSACGVATGRCGDYNTEFQFDLMFHKPLLIHITSINMSYGKIASIWKLLGPDVLNIVDGFEPEKASDDGWLFWLDSAEEEAVEVAKASSKLKRSLDRECGTNRLMSTPISSDRAFEELLKELLDLVVVSGTGIVSTDLLKNFMDKYDIPMFCKDYVIYKTARALGMCGRDIEVDIRDYERP